MSQMVWCHDPFNVVHCLHFALKRTAHSDSAVYRHPLEYKVQLIVLICCEFYSSVRSLQIEYLFFFAHI